MRVGKVGLADGRDPGRRRLAMLLFGLLAVLTSATGGVLSLSGIPSDQSGLAAVASPSAGPTSALFASDTPAASPQLLQTPAVPTDSPLATPGETDPTGTPTATPTSIPPATANPPTPTTATTSPNPPSLTPRPPTPTAKPVLPVDATLDAALARCPTAAEIAFVDARITLTFVDDPTAPELVCRADDGSADLTRLQERAYQAVLAMKRIQFDEPLPWTDWNLFRWFTHAVTGVQFRDTEFSYCCEGDRDIVIRSAAGMNYYADNHWAAREEPHFFGLMGLPGLMAHEARHAEGRLHTCGFDDDDLADMGAWAINYLYFVWLAEHANSDYMKPVDAPADLYEQQARVSAEGLRDRFCTPITE